MEKIIKTYIFFLWCKESCVDWIILWHINLQKIKNAIH